MKEFTVKDIADLIGVSKPTIQRAIKAAEIEADKEEGQTRYYSYDKAALICNKVKPDFDFVACVGQTATPPHEAEQTETTPKQPPHEAEQTETEGEIDRHTETKAATPPQNSEIELMRSMLSTIQEQLAAKDKQIAAYEAQIAAKDKQIEDYSARLAEAMQLTRGQQYIAAADKQAELLEAAAAAEVVSAEEPIEGTHRPAPVNTETGTDAAAAPKKSIWKRIFGID